MRLPRRFLVGAVAALVLIGTANADERPATGPLDREYVANARAATRWLIREVERLQEDIICDLSERKERELYRQTDAALAALVRLESSLKPGAERAQVYKDFDEAERQLHALLDVVDKLGPECRALQRAAVHVREADGQLHYALSAGDTSAGRSKQVLQRQVRALAAAAGDLERTAKYALAGNPGRLALEADLRKLVETAERLRDASERADLERLKEDFKTLSVSWDRVVRQLKALPPQENMYLLRGAAEVDGLHERLHKLLGMPGERPQLIIRS
jgi:hypothetical protein